jgi:hypothetical protein
MATANEILESLDAAEIHQRIEALNKEREALLILHRAAIRLERQGKAVEEKQAKGEGGKS